MISIQIFSMEDEVPDDHRYLNSKPGTNHRFLKRMHWEHSVLRDNLPKGIWVRGFDPRLDLLRVVMIGPHGTPYAGGAYCFDLYMDPSTFPESPPHCHYWARVGPRTDETRPLNPNLYPSGRVCLSLLGTWEGQAPQEQWSSASSILQLVISLQSLVLVSNPFFNEAGYDRMLGTPEGIRHSNAYNEHAFLLSLTTIPLSIQNPPFPFEAPLRNYYSKCLPSILNRLRLLNDEKVASSSLQNFSLKPISNGCLAYLKICIAELESSRQHL
ncbi:hypothetical protein DSO57_1020109 [Entomophthora muscae]|uniref:Uncharacterized protein n=1 Tax=Entomophthora muscae TaxID=34485 RepID=A0ACC2SSY5_9FUNG|nr:hypothetical protein DSO57_1020109 [Entomophthora muscae]